MIEGSKELEPALVFERTTQAGEAPVRWQAEPTIWTSRMLAALDSGVQGGKWYSLGDKAFGVKALSAAFTRVKSNGGAPGVDGWTVDRFESRREENLTRLESELRAGTFRPQPARRVWIPKPGTRERRPLGIPTVRDRIVQSVVKNALEPIFEAEFRGCSFGFRPGRSCRQALDRVWQALKSGKVFVVDADLRRFFDTIPHGNIMRSLESRVSDGRILDLVRAYLAQGVLENGLPSPDEQEDEGTPQGSPLSPLLANMTLHGLDALMEDSGYEIVRYADDFVVLCQSREIAEAALEAVRGWTQTNGLALHPEKTRIVDYGAGESFEFLGFAFTKGRVYPRDKSQKNLRGKIVQKTPRRSGKSLNAMIAELNPILIGWFRYFRGCPESAYIKMDGFTRRRLRAMLDQRNGYHQGYGRGATQQRWPNAYFAKHGLYSMAEACKERLILLKAKH